MSDWEAGVSDWALYVIRFVGGFMLASMGAVLVLLVASGCVWLARVAVPGVLAQDWWVITIAASVIALGVVGGALATRYDWWE